MNCCGWNRRFYCLFVLIALLFPFSGLLAQLTADFTVDKQGGCSPLTSVFTNTTRGAGTNAVYTWDLGNGNMSVNRNASATYVTEKTYTVTLTVTDGNNTSSKSMQIVVSRKPVADFTVSALSGCIPFSPQFTSTSTTPDGVLSSFVWEYGDGFSDRVSSPTVTHTYTVPVTPAVTLTVINNYGCAATVQKQAVTEVLPALTASFTVDKTIVCTVNDAVSFTNTSTGPGNLSYLWKFGDGKTQTTKNASYVYGKAGEFSASLTTSNDKGCTSSYTLPGVINVASYKLDVKVPDLLCTATNYFTFTATTYPSGYYGQWSFSDNTTYNSTNYVSKYSLAAGNYSVKVKATIGTCPVEVDKTFDVFQSPVLPGFEVDVPKCGAPATLNYKDTSSWAVKWEWRFYEAYPYYYNYTTADTKTPSKAYNSDGSYTTQLTATDANGCTATASKVQSLTRPAVSIGLVSTNATNGALISCGSFTATFKATISSGTITSYKWNLSEGVTSAAETPSNTFKTVGAHTISLEYTTSDGCKGTATIAAQVNSGPTVDFSGPATVCGGTAATFTGTASNVEARYDWYFSGPAPASSYNQYTPNLSVSFSDTGLYSVTYTVRNVSNPTSNYCSNTITKNAYIRVLPPFTGSLRLVNNCTDNKGEVTFYETSRYADKWEWDFGDNKTLTYTKANKPADVVHVYANTGRYNVTLKVTAGSCSFVMAAGAIVLLDPKISFSNNATVCGNNLTYFNNTGSTVVDAYSWYFPGVTGTASYGSGANPGVSFLDTGYFSGRLTLTVNNCTYTGNTEPNVIRVLAPYPISVTALATCNADRAEVVFTESSKGTEKWDWDFGDGGTMSYTRSNKPASVRHTYKASGWYNYKVTITTAACSFTLTGRVSVLLKQKPTLTAIQTAVCVDKDLDITLTGFETNPRANFPNYSYYYDPSVQYDDGTLFTGRHTKTIAQNLDWPYTGKWQTTYTALLGDLSRERQQIRMIIRPYGFESEYAACPDTSNYVTMRINGPTTVLKVLKNNVCNKEEIVFEDQSTVPAGNSIVNRRWSFGDGQTQTGVQATNPVRHLYNSVGNYPVSLTVTDNMGCSETKTVTAVMAGPRASFTVSPTPATNKNTVYVYNNSYALSSPTAYKWRFSYDGLQTTATTPAARTYPKGGPATDTIRLIAYNSSTGCADTMIQLLPVVNVNNAFTMRSTFMDGGCAPVLVNFTNISYNYSSFVWDFGDGTRLEDPNNTIRYPGHIYQQPGVYKVTLYGSGLGSSKDTTIDSVIIKPAAIAKDLKSSVLQTCTLQPIDFTAVVGQGSSMTWDYGDGVLAATGMQSKSTYQYGGGGIYTASITVKNSDGCAVATTMSAPILIDSLNIKLQPDPSKICDSAVVDFHPVVKSLGAERFGHTLQYSWNFGTSGSGNTSAAAAPTFKYNKAGTYTASLRVQSPVGCDKTATTTIRVLTTPTVAISGADEVCAKSGITFKGSATPDAGVVWRWDFANGTSATVPNPGSVVYNTAGNYTVKLIADNEGCARTTTHPLVVHSLPSVNPLRDTTIVIGFPVPLQATGSNDIIRWLWSPGTYLDCANCAATISVPRKHIRYEVTGYNEHGCTASAAMSIRLLCAETPIFIPNTFTPNKDGRNDLFYPRGKGVQQVTFFRIYNRLGEMIFERRNFALNDPSQGWDGTYMGRPVMPGVFTWSTDMICDAGETFSMKGTVMIIR